MTRAAIIALIVALAAIITLMMPTRAHAKATGDTVGAPKKETTTGTSRADMVDAVMPPAYFFSTTATTTATSTEKMTKKEKRAHLKALKAEIKRLEKLIRELKKSL